MRIIEKLFGKKAEPQAKGNVATVADVIAEPASGLQRETGESGSALLEEFDTFKELTQLGRFLKRHSQVDLECFVEEFPFSELSLEYKSVERDFRNSTRCEMVLHLAKILLRYDDYRTDTNWTGLLPTSLNARSLSDKLLPALMAFIEKQQGVDIAMSLRTALYDFSMDLMRIDKNREAMISLAVSNPSPREDHAFWLCASYHNVGKTDNDLQAVRSGIALAEEITSGKSKVPAGVVQKLRQTDLLSKLRALEGELSKNETELPSGDETTEAMRSEEAEDSDRLAAIDEKYRPLATGIKEWWREEARKWWASSDRNEAYCDDEGEAVSKGEGYKTGRRLLCERCTDERLTKHANWEQAVRDLNKWFGPGVPPALQSQAESLWEAPKASASAKFTMRIGSVFNSGGGVMVAGTPEGSAPSVGDKIQVVGAQGTQNGTIADTTSMGGRVAYVLSGIEEGSVKQGDMLQG